MATKPPFCKTPFLGMLTQWTRRDILMSRDKNCREIIFVSQLSRNYPHRGGNFERGKMPSLVGERQCGRHLKRELRDFNCESKIVSRQWGVKFCRETSRCLAGPSGECSKIQSPKNLLRLFFSDNLARQKITSKTINNLAGIFLCLF